MVNERTFEVSPWSDLKEQVYPGKFTMKLVLSPIEMLKKDQLRRQYLGDTSGSQPSGDAFQLSVMLSDLAVHLTDTPTWWKEMNFGESVPEASVLEDVYLEYQKIMNEWETDRATKKEAARKSIKSQTTTKDE